MTRQDTHDMNYKGYTIMPSPTPLESGSWDSVFYILLNGGGKSKITQYAPKEIHSTENEAIQYCLEAGKAIIDKL